MASIASSLPHRSPLAETLAERLNCVSLDAPLVALAWSEIFLGARIALPGETFPNTVSAQTRFAQLILALTVWLIYAADRWLDARAHGQPLLPTRRHQFSRRYPWTIAAAWSIAGLTTLVLAVTVLEARTLWLGASLGFVVFAYLLVVHRHLLASAGRWRRGEPVTERKLGWLPVKEWVVGCVFAVGTALPALAVGSAAALAVPILLFAVLCAINCQIVSVCDPPLDRSPGRPPARQLSATSRWKIGTWRFRSMMLATAVGLLSLVLGRLGSMQPIAVSAMVGASLAMAALLARVARLSPGVDRTSWGLLADYGLMVPAWLALAANGLAAW